MQPTSTLYCSRCNTENGVQAQFCRRCGQTLQGNASSAIMTERASERPLLNQRYRLVQLLGKGGMGAVYKGEDLKFQRRSVAIKEMLQSNLAPQEVRRATSMFEQEAQLLASLQHPNLPSIYDYFDEGGRWYLVMDFIEGTTLSKRLEQAPNHVLSLQRTLDIGIQLAKVLGYLHNRPSPIIFRDLKPLNIMITPDDNIYLIDFGIARLFKPGQAQDTVSYISAGYAAPEQYGTAQTSPQSDIYSLGATLHELLSGHLPNESPFKFKSLQSYNPQLPTLLTQLVAKMVDMEPSQRPASMAIVRKELEQMQMQVKQVNTPLPPTWYTPPSYNPTSTPQSNLNYIPVGQVQQNVQVARPALPRYRFWKTLLISMITAGVSLVGLVIGPIGIIVIFLVFLIAGLLVGRFVVSRQLGFLTGCIATLPYIILLFVTQSENISSIFTSLVIATITILPVGGLIALLGAWIATVNHPHYEKP